MVHVQAAWTTGTSSRGTNEERSAHTEHAYEGALLVEFVLDACRVDIGPRVDGEKDGDGIGGGQDDNGPRRVERTIGPT